MQTLLGGKHFAVFRPAVDPAHRLTGARTGFP